MDSYPNKHDCVTAVEFFSLKLKRRLDFCLVSNLDYVVVW